MNGICIGHGQLFTNIKFMILITQNIFLLLENLVPVSFFHNNMLFYVPQNVCITCSPGFGGCMNSLCPSGSS